MAEPLVAVFTVDAEKFWHEVRRIEAGELPLENVNLYYLQELIEVKLVEVKPAEDKE